MLAALSPSQAENPLVEGVTPGGHDADFQVYCLQCGLGQGSVSRLECEIPFGALLVALFWEAVHLGGGASIARQQAHTS